MNEPRHQNLGSLLNSWAKRRAPTDDQLQALRERIQQIVEQKPAAQISIADNFGFDSHPPLSETKTRALFFLCGIALSILVVLGYVSRLGPPGKNGNRSGGDEALVAATELGPARLEHQVLLLTEMQKIFDGQLEWVAEKPGKVQIGLTETDAVPDAHDHALPLTIRVVVAKRARGERRWTIEWSTDIVAKNERMVDISIGVEGDGHLRLWAYRMPEGMIAVESAFEPSQQMPVEASFESVQKERTPQKVFETFVGDVEYKIIQTVATLGSATT